jgi:hypothetical protein
MVDTAGFEPTTFMLHTHFIDGKRLINRNDRKNRHNRRYLLPNCYQFLTITKWADGLAVRDQPEFPSRSSSIGDRSVHILATVIGEADVFLSPKAHSGPNIDSPHADTSVLIGFRLVPWRFSTHCESARGNRPQSRVRDAGFTSRWTGFGRLSSDGDRHRNS